MKIHSQTVTIQVPLTDTDAARLFSDSPLLTTDIYSYSGDIFPTLDRLFRDRIEAPTNKQCVLILTTPGGDADAAFKIARLFQSQYESFGLIVPADCKSAGTLIALGAQELVFGRYGELGPLDVQIFDPDEFLSRTSGLSISQALDLLCEKAFDKWEDFFIQVRAKSRANITTQTAAEIATKLAVGIFSPISDKIDPSRLGELERSVNVALQYGIRLGARKECVKKLVNHYPSHSFAIDFREASQLFTNVREPREDETALLDMLSASFFDEYKSDFIYQYSSDAMLLRATIELKDETNAIQDSPDPENNHHTTTAASTTRRRRNSGEIAPNEDNPVPEPEAARRRRRTRR